MEDALIIERRIAEQNRLIAEVIQRERSRLRAFVRKRIDDEWDAEDILQEVFYELVETYQLLKPVEQVGAWLFRVARNRIIDFFRKKRPKAFGSLQTAGANDEDALGSQLKVGPGFSTPPNHEALWEVYITK